MTLSNEPTCDPLAIDNSILCRTPQKLSFLLIKRFSDDIIVYLAGNRCNEHNGVHDTVRMICADNAGIAVGGNQFFVLYDDG